MPPGENPREPKDKAFGTWVDVTTLHGVKDWHSSKHCCSWLVWAVVILGSLSVCLYQVGQLISVYSSATHYVSSLYVVQNQFPPFPNVTVCNLNRVNASAMAELKLTPEAIVFLFAASVTSYDFGLGDEQDLNESRDAWDRFLSRTDISSELKDPSKLLEHLGHKCEPTFVKCEFGDEWFDCCKYATKIINKDYGLCWAIKPPIDTQNLPGIANGLKLFLHPSIDQYLPNDVFLNNYLENGMVVSIDYNPYRMIFPNPININPGRHVHISLEAVEHKWLIPRLRANSPCQPDCTQNVQMKILSGPYDHVNCVSDCVQRYIYNKCGCLLISEHKTDYRTCDYKDLLACSNFTTSIRYAINKRGLTACTCKESCNRTWEIKSTTSLNDYPHERFLHLMTAKLKKLRNKKSLSPEEVRSCVNLKIYFGSPGYTVVELAPPSSLVQLLANIGGQTGLWLGGSLITLFQALYYMTYGILGNSFSRGKEKTENTLGEPKPEETVGSKPSSAWE